MFRCFALLLLLASFAVAQNQPAPQHEMNHDMSSMQKAAEPEGMDHAMHAMSSKHMDMGAHMKLTDMREVRPGDQQRADEVADAARATMSRYTDYKAALADGYRIFLPNVPMKMYHFTNYWYAVEAAFRFNPDHPTSLLYEKTGEGGYKLIGVMYTAPAKSAVAELDARVPLSVARWHEHVNMCKAPEGREREYFQPHPKFGLNGSITTAEECKKAGGKFLPQIFGWMVHVYPNEKTQDAMWSVERQMEHGH
jgi:hypothetical protein